MISGVINSMTAEWQLILRKECGDVVIQNFSTRREAKEEIENRRNLTVHLGSKPEEAYYVKGTRRKGYISGSLQNKRS